MTDQELFSYVDHTALKAFAAWDDIKKLCEEAVEYQMASVCIPSGFVRRAHEAFPALNICTVIGFPLGNCSTQAKLAETEQALRDGANEIDMVINVGLVKEQAFDACKEEILALREVTRGHVLKVIIETCYLTQEEKIRLCEIVTEAGADYIKTSTGFGTGGATMDDVRLMKEHIGPDVKIKASGGIRTKEEMKAYIEAGCSRIGTSRAI